MRDFIYNIDTKIIFGKDQLHKLAGEIKNYGSRVLICYGGGSIKRTGLYDEVTNLLDDANIFYKTLGDIKPNPRIDSVRDGRDIIIENDIDFVLAIGGGSVIDAAKLICATVFYDGDPWDFLNGKRIDKALPLGTILTIAATGSEMDAVGVISNDKTREKLAFRSKLILPKFSFLNPNITMSVNKYHSAAGVADIMSHTFENYLTLDKGCYFENRVAEAVLKTCIHFGPKIIEDPYDYEARANIMWAAPWAINGLIKMGKNTAWSVHAMEHELSAFYDITHGVGLAIITPRWMEYILNDDTVNLIREFGKNVFEIELTDDPFADAHKAIDKLFSFFKDDLKLPMSLEELNIRDNFEEMAKMACEHEGGSIDGLVKLEYEDVLNIFNNCRRYP